jgi:hypothetical protein
MPRSVCIYIQNNDDVNLPKKFSDDDANNGAANFNNEINNKMIDDISYKLIICDNF